MRWLLRHRDDITLSVLVVVLAVAVFLFFKTFFDMKPDDLTTEILAALLGTILTVMITMLLIKQQGTVEQAKEAAATCKTRVFEKKLELFRQFISIYVKSAADGVLSPKELEDLEELALTISLFTKDGAASPEGTKLGEEICRFVLQLEVFGLKTELEEADHPACDRHLGGNGVPQERGLVPIEHILRGMKVELDIAPPDSGHSTRSSSETTDYEWRRRLLAYRGYRGDDVAAASTEAV